MRSGSLFMHMPAITGTSTRWPWRDAMMNALSSSGLQVIWPAVAGEPTAHQRRARNSRFSTRATEAEFPIRRGQHSALLKGMRKNSGWSRSRIGENIIGNWRSSTDGTPFPSTRRPGSTIGARSRKTAIRPAESTSILTLRRSGGCDGHPFSRHGGSQL